MNNQDSVLTTELTRLETQDLIRRLNDPEWAYLFKHALVQDTAYASLLKNERRRLHHIIGETLERVYPEALLENAAILTQHYAEAGDDNKTLEYGTRAGDTAARLFAKSEAIQHYKSALQAALAMDVPPATVIELVTKLGRMYELQNDYQGALQVYGRLSQLAEKRKSGEFELAALMLEATLRATPTPLFDPQAGKEILDRALVLARAMQDGSAESKILWNLLQLNGFAGDYDAAVAYGEQSLALARGLGLKSQIAYTLNDLGAYGYLSRGQTAFARDVLTEARQLWDELENRPMLVDNLNISGILEFGCGNFMQAREFSTKALGVSREIESIWGISLALCFLGGVATELGEYSAALEALRPAFTLADQGQLGITWISGASLAIQYTFLGDIAAARAASRFAEGETEIKFYRTPAKATLAYITFLEGAVQRAQEILQDALDRGPEDPAFAEIGIILAEGEIGLALKRPAEVAEFMGRMADSKLANEQRCFIPDARLYQGRALEMLDQPEAARLQYEKAYALATELGSRRALWQICLTWSRLERRLGNVLRADALEIESDAIVDWILAHTPAEFREGFRQLAASR